MLRNARHHVPGPPGTNLPAIRLRSPSYAGTGQPHRLRTPPVTSCLFSHPHMPSSFALRATAGLRRGSLAGRASTTPAASPGRTCSGAATAHFWHRCPGRDGGAFALPAAGPRVKRNLFVSRPLFHLTRAPTRRPEARIGFAFANPDGDQDLSASFGMLRGEAKAGWSVVVGRQGGSDGPGSR